jgi:hypothetical protein
VWVFMHRIRLKAAKWSWLRSMANWGCACVCVSVCFCVLCMCRCGCGFSTRIDLDSKWPNGAGSHGRPLWGLKNKHTHVHVHIHTHTHTHMLQMRTSAGHGDSLLPNGPLWGLKNKHAVRYHEYPGFYEGSQADRAATESMGQVCSCVRVLCMCVFCVRACVRVYVCVDVIVLGLAGR